jgi:Tol biopolymer transport system component
MIEAFLLAVASCSGGDRISGPIAEHDRPSFPDPYAEPTWYPTGSTLVFNYTPMVRRYQDPETGLTVYDFADSLSGLWTVRSDGSGLRRLTSGYLWEPTWNRQGTRLAFVLSGDVWTVAGTDTGLDIASASRLAPSGGAVYPSWRPDGKQIAFSANGGIYGRIYIVNSGGGTPREVGEPGWAFPDWSPQGDSLVFLGLEGSNWGVCVADTNGQGCHMLLGSPGANLGPPRWSPTGGKIAVAGRVRNANAYQLWVMGSDGSNPHPLTQRTVQSEFSWSPGGNEIAYVPSGDDTSLTKGTVWIVNVQTGATRQLTYNTPSE